MPNEVLIVVKARNDTKLVFDAIRNDARRLGDEIGVDITTRVTEKIKTEARSGQSGYGQAGDSIGETIGERISRRINERVRVSVNESIKITERLRQRFTGGSSSSDSDSSARSGGLSGDRDHVKVDVDVDKQSFLQKIQALGQTAGDKLSGALSTGFGAVFNGDLISTILKVLSVSALVGALLPTLGAAISAVLLTAFSGGFIALGVMSALKDPAILAAFKDLKDRASKVFADFGENFRGPLITLLEGGGRGVQGGLLGLLNQITPLLITLGEVLGPVADKLASGLVGFLQNLLPSVIRMAEAGAPLIETLAGELPGIGDALASLFGSIAQSGPDANLFWNDFLNAIQLVIKAIGWLIRTLANMYSVVRSIIVGITSLFIEWAGSVLAAANIAFGWIPGIGPKLASAQSKFRDFKNKVNGYLDGIDTEIDVTVRIRQVFTTVGTAAVDVANMVGGKAAGGIQGAASGGPRSGLTWVGEHGPELMSVPPGSRVWSNPDSERMAAGSGSSSMMSVNLVLDGSVLARALIDPQRNLIRQSYQGNVQTAMGT